MGWACPALKRKEAHEEKRSIPVVARPNKKYSNKKDKKRKNVDSRASPNDLTKWNALFQSILQKIQVLCC